MNLRWTSGHNDRCEYCDQGGEIWCCYHCNIVAHLKCLDADADSMYVNANGEREWVCAECFFSEYGPAL